MSGGKESTSFLVDSLKDSRVVGGIMFKSMDWPRTVLEEIHHQEIRTAAAASFRTDKHGHASYMIQTRGSNRWTPFTTGPPRFYYHSFAISAVYFRD